MAARVSRGSCAQRLGVAAHIAPRRSHRAARSGRRHRRDDTARAGARARRRRHARTARRGDRAQPRPLSLSRRQRQRVVVVVLAPALVVVAPDRDVVVAPPDRDVVVVPPDRDVVVVAPERLVVVVAPERVVVDVAPAPARVVDVAAVVVGDGVRTVVAGPSSSSSSPHAASPVIPKVNPTNAVASRDRVVRMPNPPCQRRSPFSRPARCRYGIDNFPWLATSPARHQSAQNVQRGGRVLTASGPRTRSVVQR